MKKVYFMVILYTEKGGRDEKFLETPKSEVNKTQEIDYERSAFDLSSVNTSFNI